MAFPPEDKQGPIVYHPVGPPPSTASIIMGGIGFYSVLWLFVWIFLSFIMPTECVDVCTNGVRQVSAFSCTCLGGTR